MRVIHIGKDSQPVSLPKMCCDYDYTYLTRALREKSTQYLTTSSLQSNINFIVPMLPF